MHMNFFAICVCVVAYVPLVVGAEVEDPCSVHEYTYYTLTNGLGGNLGYTTPNTTKGLVSLVLAANGDDEKFSFQKIPYDRAHAEAYAILSKRHTLALTEHQGQFTLDAYTGRRSQMFHLVTTSNGQCALQMLNSEKFLGVDDALTPSYVPTLKLYTTRNGQGVTWNLNEMVCDPYPNQPYRILHRLSNLVFGIESGKESNGELVKLVQRNQDAYFAQVIFNIKHANKNIYQIILRHSKEFFDVYGRQENYGATVLQDYWIDQTNRNFVLDSAPGNSCTIRAYHSERYIGPEHNGTGYYPLGARIIQLETYPTSGALVRFERIGFQPASQKLYRLRNVHSNKYLEVKFGSTVVGAPIVQGSYDATAHNQLWSIVQYGHHVYRFHLRGSLSGLDLQIGDNEHVGSSQQTPTNNNQQLFEVKNAQENLSFFRLHFQHQNLVLTVLDSSEDAGARIVADVLDTESPAQLWAIEVDV